MKAARPGGMRPAILQCQDETQEAERVVADIRRLMDARQAEPRDVAILCRTNEQPRSFETELRRADVPYVLVGGMSFFDRKEVRDILSYLKVIDNPHDEPALMRIINQPRAPSAPPHRSDSLRKPRRAANSCGKCCPMRS